MQLSFFIWQALYFSNVTYWRVTVALAHVRW
jgi:hypothetical protein